MNILYLPFMLQGVLMVIDEVFHYKRGLGLWERLGHPLDTLTVFVPLAMVSLNDYSEAGQTVFISLGVFSCLFITKDEFIHTKECSFIENWLHSLLFILHPLIFVMTFILWKNHPEDQFIDFQPIIIGSFMLYQVFKWSIPWKKI